MILVIPMLGRLPDLLMNKYLWIAGAILILGIVIYGEFQRRAQRREGV